MTASPPLPPPDPPRQKGNNNKGANQTAKQSSKPKSARMKKPKLSQPRTTAVVITLSEESVEKGMTYSQIVRQARKDIKLGDLGIPGIKIRPTATGARKFEIPGASSNEQVDLLAEKMRELYQEHISVARPTKTADLRIVGIDDSVDREEVAEAVSKIGGCPLTQVKVGKISLGRNGLGAVVVKCPVAAAETIMSKGKLLVGWTSASVQHLAPLPMRCFKCMGTGHTKKLCPSTADYKGVCYRCGDTDHKAAECDKDPSCSVCKKAGLKSDHIMGSGKCKPPVIAKSKKAPKTQANKAIAMETITTLEEAEMST
ncbi:unnamed protein product [Diatraea saccharalis]|uniref:CCHC-type domain-containing protein n=1 Tax=Diatraea saccharalis TaxID=40085 RepID=A0A9N9R6D9_9NEOP|nr:unnamed protein product [Diatraea saccharalis]